MNKLLFSIMLCTVMSISLAQSPKSLTSTSGNSSGRIIGFLAGWKTPPPAADLAKAGYTHIIVAFGVFSTSNPGQVIPVFDSVSANYIKSLQDAGIKVLLSIGGASTSKSETTIDFHQALAVAPSPNAFSQAFIESLAKLMSQYGFDGFDFDIETGLNASGTFTNPTGDIATLAGIINTLHAKYPQLLLTLAPQVANVAATSIFSATWGNYASLVMQTYSSLTWVGIQLYNSGCALGIDNICYDPNHTNSPDASVAMATDLLANWPAKDSAGRATGFQSYISYLTPSQVVLGYVAPNSAGIGDGSPVAVITTIKRAIQCLRTATSSASSCDTYIPPKAYPDIGGVFEWEVSYDQSNGYKFATELENCVVKAQCDN